MFCPASPWIYLCIWSFSVKTRHAPALLPFSAFLQLLEINLIYSCSLSKSWSLFLVLRAELPLWEWGFVAPNLSGLFLPTRRQRCRDKWMNGHLQLGINAATVLTPYIMAGELWPLALFSYHKYYNLLSHRSFATGLGLFPLIRMRLVVNFAFLPLKNWQESQFVLVHCFREIWQTHGGQICGRDSSYHVEWKPELGGE